MQQSGIRLREKVSYGLGDFAGNMLFTLISSYLLFFYTDVAGIAIGTVGILMAIVRFVDAFANPFVGIAIDKTHTKYGKIRPFLLVTALPMAILTVLTFCAPDLSMNGKIIYAGVTYVLYSLVYTFNNTPYSTLLSNLTDNEKERLSLGMFRTLGMSIGGFVATGLTLPLVSILGQGNQARGYFFTMLIYGILCGIFILVCFFGTHERIQPPPEQNAVSLKHALKLAVQSKPWLLLCVMHVVSYCAFTLRSENTVYFAKYLLGDQNYASILLASSSIVTVVLALLIPMLASKFGKKRCTQCGFLLMAVSLFLIFLFGDRFAVVFPLHLLASVGSNVFTGMFFVMIAETVDHSEWVTGKRQQGLLNALLMFISRLGIMGASLLSAQILSRMGYVPDVAQTTSALFGIRFNYAFLPAVLALAGFILCFFYRLDNFYPQVLGDLHQRRKQGEDHTAT